MQQLSSGYGQPPDWGPHGRPARRGTYSVTSAQGPSGRPCRLSGSRAGQAGGQVALRQRKGRLNGQDATRRRWSGVFPFALLHIEGADDVFTFHCLPCSHLGGYGAVGASLAGLWWPACAWGPPWRSWCCCSGPRPVPRSRAQRPPSGGPRERGVMEVLPALSPRGHRASCADGAGALGEALPPLSVRPQLGGLQRRPARAGFARPGSR